jgi:hypothetical protein
MESAQSGTAALDLDQFVNRLPARKHDHFLIPAGTVSKPMHGSAHIGATHELLNQSGIPVDPKGYNQIIGKVVDRVIVIGKGAARGPIATRSIARAWEMNSNS